MRVAVFILAIVLPSSALAARQTLNGNVEWIRATKESAALHVHLSSMGPCGETILVGPSDAAEVLPMLIQAKAVKAKLRVTTGDSCSSGTCVCKISAVEFL